MLPISQYFTNTFRMNAGWDGIKCRFPRKMGKAKPASSGFLMTGHTVSHISHSSEPPMSNRVVALNSFVLLAREVVSVLLLYRVVALMVFFVDRLPALFVFVKAAN